MRIISNLLLFLLLACQSGHALGGDQLAGEARYSETCFACHGPAGKGVASYPKISGQQIAYTVAKLEAYRDHVKQGPNSALMFMMAEELTDEEILNLAVYLKDAETNK
jgi:cytochrome c553